MASAGFNIQDYITVADRIALAHAEGWIKEIRTAPPVMLTATMGFIRATVIFSDGTQADGIGSFQHDDLAPGLGKRLGNGKADDARTGHGDCPEAAQSRGSSERLAARESVAVGRLLIGHAMSVLAARRSRTSGRMRTWRCPN